MDKLLIPDYYKDYLAKEKESLYAHTGALLQQIEELKKTADIFDEDMLRLACIYHDIGKISALFQERLKKGGKFDANTEIGHNVLSGIIAWNLLEGSLEKEKLYNLVYAVLEHHHYENNLKVLEEKKELIANNITLFNHLGLVPEVFPLRNLVVEKLKRIKNTPSKELILLKGFLHKCDYAASAHRKIEIKNEDLLQRTEKLGYQWNAMQKFAKQHSEKNILIVGSTGLGKTEAALLWLGNHKGFYVLPLRTAINAMYERLKKSLYKKDYEENLGLLHGETKGYYLSTNDRQSAGDAAEKDKFWEYYEMTKNLSLPFTIATLDQLFRFVYKYPGYETILSTFSYAKMVIDEIQAYSPELLAYLIYGLQRIHDVGGRFAVMTATFPPFIRDLLNIGYSNGDEIKIVEGKFLNKRNRHWLHLVDEKISAKEIADFYVQKAEKESAKILVVVNTVKKAQELYRQLQEDIGERVSIYLLHAKFIGIHRREKEAAISESGKTEKKEHVIWIATQVVEASLDIDFDYLFTELSELCSLFQRLGRVNRKGEKKLQEANAFVYLQTDGDNLKRKLGNRGFIDIGLYQLSREALKEWEEKSASGIMSEQEKCSMIERFYNTACIKAQNESDYLDRFRKTYNEIKELPMYGVTFDEVCEKFRGIHSISLIPETVYRTYNVEALEEEVLAAKRAIQQEREKEPKDDKAIKRLLLEYARKKDVIMRHTVQTGFLSARKNVVGYVKVGRLRISVVKIKYSREMGLTNEAEEEGSLFI